MKNKRVSIPDDDDHQVLPFRPREGTARPAPAPQPARRPPAIDLTRYERGRDESPDDFRHRMLTNLAALAFTVALIVIGFWLATSIADMRRTQDCVLMGRRDCAHIPAP